MPKTLTCSSAVGAADMDDTPARDLNADVATKTPPTWHAWCGEFGIPGTPEDWDRMRETGAPTWIMYLRGLRASGFEKEAAAAAIEESEVIPWGITSAPQPKPTELRDLPLSQIITSDYNPRETFDEEALKELAASIKEHGILEPIVVRHITRADNLGWAQEIRQGYEIVAGERRFRASKLAGMETIPALVRELDDKKARVLAVIENLQRRDLDPFEEARGFETLIKEGYSQRQIIAQVGCSQSRISKTLNLTRLPLDVQTMIREGKLTPSHGERLVKYADFPKLCSGIAELATQKQVTVAELDKGIPFVWQLQQLNLVKGYNLDSPSFDTSVCKQCPFNAYRKGEYAGYAYCLKPEHWDELEQAAITARQEELRQAQEAMAKEAEAIQEAAAFGEIPAVDGEPETAKKVAAKKHLPMIDSLRHGTYENLSYISSIPADCTQDCPCRASALRKDRGGDTEVVPICSNPERFKKLRDGYNRAQKKAARTDFAEREKAVQEIAEEHLEWGKLYEPSATTATHRLTVVALWDSLRSAGKTAVEPAAKRLGIELDFSLWDKTSDHTTGGYSGYPVLWDHLEKLEIALLLRLTVEAHMAREILARFGYSNPKPSDSLHAIDWITAAGKSEAEDA